jgi:hypothetical protein
VTVPAPKPTYRLELTLRKPWLGWFPKPTVALDGRGQPAQWGKGTWQISAESETSIEVFLFNRLWRYGSARVVLDGDGRTTALVYSAPWLPFGSGRISTG